MATIRPPLILASTSPYRRMLLERLHLPFECVAPGVDEAAMPDEAPLDLALRLARAKAEAVAHRHPDAVVIGSDQVALCGDTVLGKPGDAERAARQLRLMSGQTVVFHSAVAVLHHGQATVWSVPTHCHLRELDDAAITRYLQLERPFDTAGSAKVEGLGITLMESIESVDPTALIGLPLISLTTQLRQAGIDPLSTGPGAA